MLGLLEFLWPCLFEVFAEPNWKDKKEERHYRSDSCMIVGRCLSHCCMDLVSMLNMLALDVTLMKQRGPSMSWVQRASQIFLKIIGPSFYYLEANMKLECWSTSKFRVGGKYYWKHHLKVIIANFAAFSSKCFDMFFCFQFWPGSPCFLTQTKDPPTVQRCIRSYDNMGFFGHLRLPIAQF